MQLNINRSSSKPHVTRLSLSGRLDTNTTPELEKVIDDAIAEENTSLVFDLEALGYISSAGLRALFRAKKTCEGKGGDAFVVNLQPQVQKVFDIVKAMPGTSIFTSWEELDAYLDTMQKKILEGDG
jgi:anti-anti-sigma factor